MLNYMNTQLCFSVFTQISKIASNKKGGDNYCHKTHTENRPPNSI